MARSTENDIRAAVVTRLLTDGLAREQIRLEIPLDTASYTGRADIVILNDKIGCIELKSGKDKYCPDAIKVQRKQYERAFDGVAICVDLSHKREQWVDKDNGSRYLKTNWLLVNLEYDHEKRVLVEKRCADPVIPTVFRWGGIKTSAYDMASLLWVSEVREITGTRATKCSFVQDMRENGKLSELRPKVIAALKGRPLNKWEAAFWKHYEARL